MHRATARPALSHLRLERQVQRRGPGAVPEAQLQRLPPPVHQQQPHQLGAALVGRDVEGGLVLLGHRDCKPHVPRLDAPAAGG